MKQYKSTRCMELCRVLKAESFHLKHSCGHVCVFDVLKTEGNLVFMLSAQFLDPWNSSFGTFRAEGRGAKVFTIHFKAIFYLAFCISDECNLMPKLKRQILPAYYGTTRKTVRSP